MLKMATAFVVAPEFLASTYKEQQNMMGRVVRLFATAPLLFGLMACATAIVPGDTRASPPLQRDTLQMILILDGASDGSCDQRKIVNTEVVKMATVNDYTAAERWTLDRCGKLVRYSVTFSPGPGGATDFSVRLER